MGDDEFLKMNMALYWAVWSAEDGYGFGWFFFLCDGGYRGFQMWREEFLFLFYFIIIGFPSPILVVFFYFWLFCPIL